jgi:hypothetical protein
VANIGEKILAPPKVAATSAVIAGPLGGSCKSLLVDSNRGSNRAVRLLLEETKGDNNKPVMRKPNC